MMNHLRLVSATVLMLVCLGSQSSVFGATASETFKRWADLTIARSLKCVFKVGSTAVWKGGKVRIETDRDEITIHFDSIDHSKKTARMIGNGGADDVIVLSTPGGITFYETMGSGNRSFTTVFPDYEKGIGGEFVAVLSKHVLLNHPMPSQWHGTCQVVP